MKASACCDSACFGFFSSPLVLGPDEAGTSMLERGPSGGLVGGDLGGGHQDGGTWNLSWREPVKNTCRTPGWLSQS